MALRLALSLVGVGAMAMLGVARAAELSGTVQCGPGFDLVNAELADIVDADCELVARQLSRDALRAFRAQHETRVEPDSLAVGSTVVTAFLSGRFVDGGAAGIGWATSRDAGRTWTSGFCSAPPIAPATPPSPTTPSRARG